MASLLAREIGAGKLIILTGVERVFLDFGKPTERPIPRMSAAEAKLHMAEGQFPAGSMQPKIEAALGYLEAGGSEAVITSIDTMADALAGQNGTVIYRG